MKTATMPSLARLKELLHFDPVSGDFTWITDLCGHRAFGKKAGAKTKYVRIVIDGVAHMAHRLAWLYEYGQDPGDFEIDHINGDKFDNAIKNLRLVTRKQNNENVPVQRNNTSGARGVHKIANCNKWEAYIYHNKRRIHIGRFDDMQSAQDARLQKQRELFTHANR